MSLWSIFHFYICPSLAVSYKPHGVCVCTGCCWAVAGCLLLLLRLLLASGANEARVCVRSTSISADVWHIAYAPLATPIVWEVALQRIEWEWTGCPERARLDALCSTGWMNDGLICIGKSLTQTLLFMDNRLATLRSQWSTARERDRNGLQGELHCTVLVIIASCGLNGALDCFERRLMSPFMSINEGSRERYNRLFWFIYL